MPLAGCHNSIINYTLSFTPANLSAFQVISWKPSFSRLTPIARRQNYWANRIILDGRYPALQWDHEFTMTKVSSSPLHLVQDFIALSHTPPINSDPRPLLLRAEYEGNHEDVVVFGNCYLEDVSLGQPDSLLMTAAGMFTLKFSGTQIPSIAAF